MRSTRSRKSARALLGAVAAATAAVATAVVPAAASTSGPVAQPALAQPPIVPTYASNAAPAVLPAPGSWRGGVGRLTVSAASRIVVGGAHPGDLPTARTLATELHSARAWRASVVTSNIALHPGDVVLQRDSRRTDLGAEGYTLSVGRQVVITAATPAGEFYGTQTMLQMLAHGASLPVGSIVDVPRYRERAIAVSATLAYPMSWLENLVKDMAYVKLNRLHLEMKVQSRTDSSINFLPYFTRTQMAQLVALAAQYHVLVVPEMNGPGHMSPFVSTHPELQLINPRGVHDTSRLDITKPAAAPFYSSLIKDNASLFNSSSWDLGADEYLADSSYPNYPQMLAYARARYGSRATAQTAFVDFVNRIDGVARSYGRYLRVWNDGFTGHSSVALKRDVIVEYWCWTAVSPQAFLNAGYTVVNASADLYYIRGGRHPNIPALYASGWTPQRFIAPYTTTASGRLAGAEMSIWNDNYRAEGLRQTEINLYMPLRFMAQATWGTARPSTYSAFLAEAQALGRAPGWQQTAS